MDHFPVFLNLRNRRALLIGGNALAARKAALIAKSDARITVLADNFSAAMLALAQENPRLELLTQSFSNEHLNNTALVLAATDDEALNHRVFTAAEARGIPVNVADCPELCSYILPAIVDRAPVIVAVSTGGRSPVLARAVKALLERALPQTLGAFAELLQRWRAPVAAAIANPQRRRRFWEQLINGPIAQQTLSGDCADAEQIITAALAGESGAPVSGSLVLVGAPEQDPEWLSMKAHRLIQQAECLVYDDDTAAALLELGRREAHTLNADRQPRAQLRDSIAAKVKQGQRVVRIYGRDSGLSLEAQSDNLAFQTQGLSPLAVPAPSASFGAPISPSLSGTASIMVAN